MHPSQDLSAPLGHARKREPLDNLNAGPTKKSRAESATDHVDAEEEGSFRVDEDKKQKVGKCKVQESRKGLTALGDIYISRSLWQLPINCTDL
jgi:hypothetical protein